MSDRTQYLFSLEEYRLLKKAVQLASRDAKEKANSQAMKNIGIEGLWERQANKYIDLFVKLSNSMEELVY